MGKNKTDAVMEGIYAEHLGFKNNPQQTNEIVKERIYVRMISELCMNRFKWEGFPPEIDTRFLEMELFRRGLNVFFYAKDYERYFAMRGAPAGRWNMYDNPTAFIVTGNGMIDRHMAATNCVPIWANYMRTPDLDIVFEYSKRLARADRTIDVIMQNLRNTTIISSPESMRLSWANILRQHTEGQPFILTGEEIGNQFASGQAVQVFDTGGNPDKLPKIMEARNQIWSQCMGLLGINNANTDKRERLAGNEVDANNEQVGAMRSVVMNAREQACEMINRKYPGLNVSVKFNTEVLSAAETLNESLTVDPTMEGLV